MTQLYFKSTKNDDIGTPPELYKELDALFHFDHDPCPLHATVDGLAEPWGVSNFVNPPFSDIQPWIERAVSIAEHSISVLLIPMRSNAAYWRNVIFPNARKIYLLTHRVIFSGFKRTFPTPMALVVFGPRSIAYPRIATLQGWKVITLESWQ